MKTLSTTSLKQLLNLIKNKFFMKSEAVEADALSVDTTPTASSTNLVTSGGVKTYADTKSVVSVSSTGTATTEANYITINGTEHKIVGVSGGYHGIPIASSITAWGQQCSAGSVTPALTLPAPTASATNGEEIIYIFTAATTGATFTAPSGYILGESTSGFAGLSAGNTLTYTSLTVGSIYEMNFYVLDSTHISLVMTEHKTA